MKEEAPIFIYERWITFPGKVPAVKAREVKSEFLINASIYKILSILPTLIKLLNEFHAAKANTKIEKIVTLFEAYLLSSLKYNGISI